MLIRLLCSLTALLCASTLLAQTQNHDYYQAHLSPTTAQLLNNVEKYHEEQSKDYMRRKQYDGAWKGFDFILRYFPNHPRGLLLMSELCLVWKNRQCDMESYFDKAVRLSPNHPGVYLTKGIYLHKRGKLNEAIDSYKKSLEFNPSSANAHYNLGLVYVAQKQYSLANEHAQQAYALGIDLPGLRNKLIAAGAWKVIEAKPTQEVQETGQEAKAVDQSK